MVLSSMVYNSHYDVPIYLKAVIHVCKGCHRHGLPWCSPFTHLVSHAVWGGKRLQGGYIFQHLDVLSIVEKCQEGMNTGSAARRLGQQREGTLHARSRQQR